MHPSFSVCIIFSFVYRRLDRFSGKVRIINVYTVLDLYLDYIDVGMA